MNQRLCRFLRGRAALGVFGFCSLALTGWAIPDTNAPAVVVEAPIAAAAPEVAARVPPFSRYEIILTRKPFGSAPALPAGAQAAAAVQTAVAQQALAKQIRLCAVTLTEEGISIGLVDSAAKPPRNLLMKVGDNADGYRIVDADFDAETATIEKDGVVITLNLEGLVASPAAGGAPRPALPTLPLPSGAPPRPLALPTPTTAAAPKERAKEPAFKTSTEQLMGMIASTPPGSSPPPLPISDDDDMEEDTKKALSVQVVIHDDDDDATVTHKENVAWIKEDMRQTLAKEGSSSGGSYIRRLYERQKEAARKRQEEADRLRKLAEESAKEKLQAEIAAANARLEAEGAHTIEPGEIINEDEAQ